MTGRPGVVSHTGIGKDVADGAADMPFFDVVVSSISTNPSFHPEEWGSSTREARGEFDAALAGRPAGALLTSAVSFHALR